MLFAHAHLLFLIGAGAMMGIGGVVVGLEHWKDDIQEGRSPFTDPYVQGTAIVLGFFAIAGVIVVSVITRGVRRRLISVEQERRLFATEESDSPD